MKAVLIAIFVIISNFSHGQTEQKSLDFFAESLLPKIKKSKIYYDGKIIDKTKYEEERTNSDDETLIEIILWDYYLTQKDRTGLSNKENDLITFICTFNDPLYRLAVNDLSHFWNECFSEMKGFFDVFYKVFIGFVFRRFTKVQGCFIKLQSLFILIIIYKFLHPYKT